MMQHLAVTDMVTDPWFHVSLVNVNAVKINFSKDQVKTADLNVNPHASKTSEPNIPKSGFFLFVTATSLSCQSFMKLSQTHSRHGTTERYSLKLSLLCFSTEGVHKQYLLAWLKDLKKKYRPTNKPLQTNKQNHLWQFKRLTRQTSQHDPLGFSLAGSDVTIREGKEREKIPTLYCLLKGGMICR